MPGPSSGEPGDRQRGEQVVAEKGWLACHAWAGGDVTGKVGGSFDRWTGSDSPWMTVSTIWNHAFRMESRPGGRIARGRG